mgnify:CR=1 FL=1
MKHLIKGISIVALISAVNVASAAEPIELASADLDYITAGGVLTPTPIAPNHGPTPNLPSISFSGVVGATAFAAGDKAAAGALTINTVTNGTNHASTLSGGFAAASGSMFVPAVALVNTGAVVSLLTN